MPEFVVPGEDDASVFPEFFENGKLKPEYAECLGCGKTGCHPYCDKCWEALASEDIFGP